MLKKGFGRVKINFNQLDRAYLQFKDEYDDAVLKVLASGMYILGEEVVTFEKNFTNFIGSKFCLGLNSGLDALVLAIRALGIGPGDEVIVPANTYIASVMGITINGANPIFVEPDEFYNMNVNLIEEKITDKTKAVLAVHLYGQAANLKKIKEITDKHDLYLIEDCAQSHGGKYEDVTTGTWGDIGCFSFYPTKNLGAFGDGGAIVTNNNEIYNTVKMFRNYGSRIKYENEEIGLNSRLDEIQAALLSVKLKHYEALRKDRGKIAKAYLEGIKNDKIALPTIRIDAEHVWHLFVIRVENRDKFQQHLLDNGISSQIHYPIPPHLSKAYSYLEHKVGDFPLTEKYADTVVSLPLYEGMREEEIEYVVKVVNLF